jgi:hypothetical protein
MAIATSPTFQSPSTPIPRNQTQQYGGIASPPSPGTPVGPDGKPINMVAQAQAASPSMQAASGATPLGNQPDYLQQIWNLLQSALAGGQAQSNAQIGGLNAQLGAILANQGTQSGLINQQQGIDLGRVGLRGDQLGIQQGALNRQTALAPQMEALAQQLFGVSHADIGAARTQAGQLNQQQLRGEESSATARGANVTAGHRQNIGDINTQLQNTLGGIGRQEQRLGVSEKEHALSYKEQQAQLADQQKNLDILSKSLGYDKQEIENRTKSALNQLGLSTTLSTNDIYNAIIQAQQGQFSPVSQILPIIYNMTGLAPAGGG